MFRSSPKGGKQTRKAFRVERLGKVNSMTKWVLGAGRQRWATRGSGSGSAAVARQSTKQPASQHANHYSASFLARIIYHSCWQPRQIINLCCYCCRCLPLSAAAFQSSACHVAVEATACGCQLCDTAPWHSGEHFGCQQTHLDFCLCPLLQPICLSVSVCVLLIFGCVVVWILLSALNIPLLSGAALHQYICWKLIKISQLTTATTARWNVAAILGGPGRLAWRKSSLPTHISIAGRTRLFRSSKFGNRCSVCLVFIIIWWNRSSSPVVSPLSFIKLVVTSVLIVFASLLPLWIHGFLFCLESDLLGFALIAKFPWLSGKCFITATALKCPFGWQVH